MVYRIYHDWEFLEDGATLAPISVGIVPDDGYEYYAVNADMPWERVVQHQWLAENVVPHLPIAGAIGAGRTPVLDRLNPLVKPIGQIRDEVRRLILVYPNPQLWGWYSDFDHVALSWLFGPMAEMPPGVPRRTNDVQQEADRLGVAERDLPQQQGGFHDALEDARHVRRVHYHLIRLESDRARESKSKWVS